MDRVYRYANGEVPAYQDGLREEYCNAVILTNEEYDTLRARLDSARVRKAAQILIEEIGAPGPESVDETATRATDHIAALERELAGAKERVVEVVRAEGKKLRLEGELAEAKKDSDLLTILDNSKPVYQLNHTETGAWEIYSFDRGRIGGPGPLRDAIKKAFPPRRNRRAGR